MDSFFRLLSVCCFFLFFFFWVWHSTVVVDHLIGTAMRAQFHPQWPDEIDLAPHNTAIHIWQLTAFLSLGRTAAMSEWRFASLEGGVDSGDDMFRLLGWRFVNDILTSSSFRIWRKRCKISWISAIFGSGRVGVHFKDCADNHGSATAFFQCQTVFFATISYLLTAVHLQNISNSVYQAGAHGQHMLEAVSRQVLSSPSVGQENLQCTNEVPVLSHAPLWPGRNSTINLWDWMVIYSVHNSLCNASFIVASNVVSGKPWLLVANGFPHRSPDQGKRAACNQAIMASQYHHLL